MPSSGYSTSGIHLPQDRHLIHALKTCSVILSSAILLIGFSLAFLNTSLPVVVMFTLSAGSLLLHATDHSSPTVKF